jgi:HEAT repeat protein
MSRAVLQPFEEYQKSRITFVQTIAELATRPQNIEALHSAGVMQLLRPLLLDSVPSIQQSAALAIGRLANHSEELAESVVQNDIIAQLIYSLSNQNRFFKKAACFVLRAVAKHSPQLADDVVKSGALEPLVKCLEEFDPTVKESSAWALGYIAKHNASLAHQVVEARAVDALILCLQEPEIILKRAAAQTLSYICQHTEQLAQPVAENGLDTITFFLT